MNAPSSPAVAEPETWRARAWTAVSGALGTAAGILPHVLHHVGPLVGAAFLTGALGTAAFGAVGLLLSVPMLLRLRRRFGNWWAPALGLAAFTAMFLLSSLVLGPLISGSGPAEPAGTGVEHVEHHG